MKRMTVLLLSVLLSGVFLLTPLSAGAAPDGSSSAACEALGNVSPGGGDCDNPDGPGLNKVIEVALNMLSIVAGIIAVIMMIVSGFKYVTSRGDATQVSSAKNSLIYVVAGLIVVAFSQLIVQFVLTKATGA